MITPALVRRGITIAGKIAKFAGKHPELVDAAEDLVTSALSGASTSDLLEKAERVSTLQAYRASYRRPRL